MEGEGAKIIANGDCSHEIKRHLALGRKVMTNLYSIFTVILLCVASRVFLISFIALFIIY